MSEIVMTGSKFGGGSKSNRATDVAGPSRKPATDDEVEFVSENQASTSARRSRAIASARRFHSRNMADIQRQAERGRRKRMEYEAKREKIQNELNHQKEAEERRTQQVRALASSRDQEVRALERLGAIPRQPTRNMERDLELLDIQREQFYSGLVDSHARQQQQMEEYELALALSLSMAEMDNRGNSHYRYNYEPDPSERVTYPVESLMYPSLREGPSSLVSPAYGSASARHRGGSTASGVGRSRSLPAPTPTTSSSAGLWEMDGMSYEDLCKLEDVKVTLPKSAINRLETTVLKENLKTEDVCSICQCGFEKGEKVMNLPCGHTFHAECAEEWLGKYSTNCPVCKERVA